MLLQKLAKVTMCAHQTQRLLFLTACYGDTRHTFKRFAFLLYSMSLQHIRLLLYAVCSMGGKALLMRFNETGQYFSNHQLSSFHEAGGGTQTQKTTFASRFDWYCVLRCSSALHGQCGHSPLNCQALGVFCFVFCTSLCVDAVVRENPRR